jgi:hypothetical protein
VPSKVDVPQQCQLTFNGQHGIRSQKTDLFITTPVTNLIIHQGIGQIQRTDPNGKQNILRATNILIPRISNKELSQQWEDVVIPIYRKCDEA